MKNDVLCLFNPYRFMLTPYMNKEHAKFSQIKRAKGVFIKIRDVLLADWFNVILHIHDDCCWPEVLFCYFEMLAVGVRREMIPSTLEANSLLWEAMATTFGEEKSVDTHFCQWLVSISWHSSFASNISTK